MQVFGLGSTIKVSADTLRDVSAETINNDSPLLINNSEI